MPQTYRIREFESFTKKHIDASGFVRMREDTFNALEAFVLENKKESSEIDDVWELLSISVKHGMKVISARNYVGLITMRDGTNIEILPKIDHADEVKTRQIFLDMLKTVRDIPYKTVSESSISTAKTPLYEIYIRVFLDEVNALIKRGIKFGYVHHEDNAAFLKGRLCFNDHIKQNLTHKERFYIAFDEFEANRPENKLIKSTLGYVMKRSHDGRNRKICKRLLTMMSEVDESTDYESDFSKYSANRNMKEYDTLIKLCRVFLMNKSFISYKGKHVTFALLFPMEQLFESYVADKIKKSNTNTQRWVLTQDRRYHLFDSPKKKFALKPDIVVMDNQIGKTVVLDTKWKVLSPAYNNYGIAQADMYQMYAYHKKYKPTQVILIYPYNSHFQDTEFSISYTANEEQAVTVKTVFFDLSDTKGSVRRITEMIETD